MTPRGPASRALWWLLWGCALTLLLTEAVDAWLRAAPAVVWLLKLGPLLVLLPWVWRDRLRSVIWVCFVCLLYFVPAVQRVFAEPQSPRALLELLAVTVLFIAGMLYVRRRAAELRRDPQEASA